MADINTALHTSLTYPWVGADAAVQGRVVPRDSERVDERLRELGRLCEVVVDVFWVLQVHP